MDFDEFPGRVYIENDQSIVTTNREWLLKIGKFLYSGNKGVER